MSNSRCTRSYGVVFSPDDDRSILLETSTRAGSNTRWTTSGHVKRQTFDTLRYAHTSVDRRQIITYRNRSTGNLPSSSLCDKSPHTVTYVHGQPQHGKRSDVSICVDGNAGQFTDPCARGTHERNLVGVLSRPSSDVPIVGFRHKGIWALKTWRARANHARY